jgi:Arc/MetJ family transcription regulator
MRTNIVINDELVKKGLNITKLKTKKDLVNFALSELIRREKMYEILDLRGKVKWDGNLEKMREARKW